MVHGHYQAVYQDIWLAIEAARQCEHGRCYKVYTEYGYTCCNCGLTESNGIHPGYFKVKWMKLLEVGK